MRKTWIVLITLITLLLTACGNSQTQKQKDYPVYLSSQTEDRSLFTANVKTYPPAESTSTVGLPKKISLPVGNKVLEMEHTKSAAYAHKYTSADGKISCWLAAETGALYMLSFDIQEFLPGLQLTKQADLEKIAQQIVSQYYEEDWSQYAVSCTTTLGVTGQIGAWSETREGLCSPANENEKVNNYELTFRRQIAGDNTSDRIVVTCSFLSQYQKDTTNSESSKLLSDTMRIQFSAHEFDEIQTINLDKEKIDESIDAFFEQNLSEGYTLQGLEKHAPIISREGDQLLYKCRLSVSLLDKQYGTEIPALVDLIIDPEISVTDKAVLSPVRPYTVLETAPVTESVK